MASAWIGVVGVLVGSGITASVSVLTARTSGQRAARESLRARRSVVYAEMIAAVGALGLMIGNIRVVLEADSGAKASPLLSGRRLSSTIELIDFLRRDMDGLLSAAGQVWVHGSQDAIDSANALVSHSVVLLGLGTSKGVARTALETAIRGQAWTVAQRDTLDEEIKRLAQLRRDFAALARRETGLPAVALFTSDVFPGQ